MVQSHSTWSVAVLPDPLHPAVVHFPVVLVVLLPLVVLGALWAIRRGVAPGRAWAVPVFTAALLAVSAWAALKTGEGQEDRVEEVVPEQALHAHEEDAERFLALSGVLVVIMSAGLIRGRVGRAARVVATAGAFGLVVAGVAVGHSGGELVYTHGAASAYVGFEGGTLRSSQGAQEGPAGEAEHDD
jgi:uncharacterized membrane protein